MGAKPHKQKQGQHEAALIALGNAEATYAERFNPATNAVVKSANRDDTELLRGRANADAAQAFAGSAEVLQGGRGLAAYTEQADLRSAGTGAALREANQTGMEMRDDAIDRAGGLLNNQAMASSRGLAEVARQESTELAQKADLANQARAQRLEMAASLASAAGTYAAGKMADSAAAKERARTQGSNLGLAGTANHGTAMDMAGVRSAYQRRKAAYPPKRPGG